jgi:hypothetical protein
MPESTPRSTLRQKVGGFAALYLALAYVAAIPYFLLVSNYQQATTPAEKIASLLANHQSTYAMYLVSYVFFGVVLAVLTLALFDRVRAGGEASARVMTFVGLAWAVALIMSGMVWNYGMETVVSLAQHDPQQAATAWLTIETIANGLGGAGGETLGGLWMLLVSWTALRAKALPKALIWLGAANGLLGLASTIPALHDAALAFGMLQIVWFAWLGIALLAHKTATREAVSSRQVLGGAA